VIVLCVRSRGRGDWGVGSGDPGRAFLARQPWAEESKANHIPYQRIHNVMVAELNWLIPPMPSECKDESGEQCQSKSSTAVSKKSYIQNGTSYLVESLEWLEIC